MSNTRIELVLERESGLTESAIEAQLRQQFRDEITQIEVVKQ